MRRNAPMKMVLDAEALRPTCSYMGWWVVAALFICGLFVFGGGLYSFVLLLEPLSRDFGWSRASTAGLISIFWLASPLALFSGPLLKRFDLWHVMACGIIIEAACLMMLAFVSELWQMYVLRVLMGFGKILVYVVTPVAVSQWFSKRFGTALAITFAGWHIGGWVLVPLVGYLIHASGWRLACQILAAGLAISSVLPMLLSRWARPPQATNLRADGVTAGPAGGTDTSPWSILRRPSWWLVVVGTFCVMLGITGTLIHQAAIVDSAGASAAVVSFTVAFTGAFAACGALGAGWVVDRHRLSSAAALQQLVVLLGMASLLIWIAYPLGLSLLITHVVFFGLAFGSTDIFWATVLKRRFGDRQFPQLLGVWYFIALAASVLGPVLAGWVFDVSGTYLPVVAALIVVFAVGAVAAIAISRSIWSHATAHGSTEQTQGVCS